MAGVGLMPAAVSVVGACTLRGDLGSGLIPPPPQQVQVCDDSSPGAWPQNIYGDRSALLVLPAQHLRGTRADSLHLHNWGRAKSSVPCKPAQWVAGSTTECTPWWKGPAEEYSLAFLPAPHNTGHISETDGFNFNNWGADSTPSRAMTTTEQREGHTQHPAQALFTTTLITCPLTGPTHGGKTWQAPGLRTALSPETLDSCRPHRNSPT